MDWKPQPLTEPWKKGVGLYVGLLRQYGPPGASSNGYNETLALFSNGNCAMRVDATVAASSLSDPKQSKVAGKLAYAHPPYGTVDKGNHCLWSWALAVPKSSKVQADAKRFVYRATSKRYIDLVARTEGVVAVPPGTRTSTYADPDYLRAAPFARLTLETIETADMDHPTVEPVPYRGISFVAVPEFQGIGTRVGQEIAAAISGQRTVGAALASVQAGVEQAMRKGGTPKP